MVFRPPPWHHDSAYSKLRQKETGAVPYRGPNHRFAGSVHRLRAFYPLVHLRPPHGEMMATSRDDFTTMLIHKAGSGIDC